MTTQNTVSITTPKTKPIEFNGLNGEYFKIWIVNLALTIVTFGIYSAWAKVRTKKYFYGNTQILGQSFEYLATGGQIFKGRLIAAFAYFLFVMATELLPLIASGIVTVLFIFAIPFLMNAGLRFNARVSTWRNVNFTFNGNYLKALLAMFVYPLLGVLTLGIVMPWAVRKSAEYIVTHHAYGDEAFKFEAETSDYARTIYGLVIIYISMIIVIALGATMSNSLPAAASTAMMIIPVLVIYGAAFSIKPLLFNIYWNNVLLNGNGFKVKMPVGKYIWVFLSNSFAVVLSIGLLYPWSQIRMARFTAQSMRAVDVGNIGLVADSGNTTGKAVGDEMADMFDADIGFGI